MATFLDLSLFGHVSAVFIFLFVFLVVYAFLHITKLMNSVPGHNGIYAIIALTLAVMSSFSQGFIMVIMTMAPWFTVIIVFLFLAFFVTRMFTTDDAMFENMIKKGAVKWILIIIFVIILIVSISSSFGQQMLDDGTGQTSTPTSVTAGDQTNYATSTTDPTAEEGVATDDFGTNVLQTMFHPKVLGMLLMILIGFFTVLLIARTSDPSN